jgi:hypothetical protein
MLRVVPREWKLPEWTSEELAKEPPAFRGLKDMNLMHRQSLKFFADSNTISERERTDVALKAGPQTTEQMWEIKSLDLVGVVMHEAPVVYVSEKLPAMDQLSQRPTREPDLFESEGLEELMNGKDLYIRSKDSTVRVLGPLKAGKACLKCHHDSKEGDVLGAFSYTLRPADDRWQVRDGRGLPPGVSGQPALKK